MCLKYQFNALILDYLKITEDMSTDNMVLMSLCNAEVKGILTNMAKVLNANVWEERPPIMSNKGQY